MQILYGYSNCTDKKYYEIMKDSNISVLLPDQKYHGLLIKGLAENGVDVKCLSGLPINRAVTKKLVINQPDEKERNVYYHYYFTLNIPGIRQLMIFFAALWSCLKIEKKTHTYAICDCLNIANAYGMLIGCKLRKVPIVTIVTDLPDMLSDNNFLKKINNNLFSKVDGFIFLTQQMNTRINRKKKPYIVLEGHVDAEAPDLRKNKSYEEESGKKVIVYAGSTTKLYGVKKLVEGFKLANISDAELHIFGDGDYREELIEICRQNSSIKYMGIRDNQTVVREEIRPALLVNPRPTKPEYTKYSFPSKNMEYMVSGTPMLTTKLAGMPEEYYPYIYLIKDESIEGISKALKDTLNEKYEKRKCKGEEARKFVLHNKSNVVQAERIINFLKRKM